MAQQDFSFTKERREIRNSGATYIFIEFFMKDLQGNNVKCYNIYGNLPSKNHFVEISLYHLGQKKSWLKSFLTWW
jgi:hypothetical protein